MHNFNMIGVVIPCYRVKNEILSLIAQIGKEVEKIYVVDDACPQQTGQLVEERCNDPRIKIIKHTKNLGVGGAMISGYKAALKDKCEVIVKLDGDNQMDPNLIPSLIRPIKENRADYVKGNRFFSWHLISSMPKIRLFGNSGLSFFNKLSSGYWSVMDPTNGYTAIHSSILEHILRHPIANDYFFESDILFRLGTYRAVICDLPMKALYNNETSSLKLGRTLFTFPPKLILRTIKRIFYNYYIRDFSIGSIYLIFSIALLSFGGIFGVIQWLQSIHTPATSGTVMLAALPVILGIQFLLSFISFDILSEPHTPIHQELEILAPKQNDA